MLLSSRRCHRAQPPTRAARIRAHLDAIGLSLFALLALVTGAQSAAAQVMVGPISYEITGTIDGFSFDSLGPVDYFPTGFVPYENGAAYTLTFTLDPSAPLTGSGATFAGYDTALSNLLLEIELFEGGFDFVSADEAGVFETFNAFFHTWAPGAFEGNPNFSSTIPDFDVEDDFGNTETVFFTSFDVVLFDDTLSLYTMNPAELVAPDLSDASSAQIDLFFQDFNTGDAFVAISGTVDTVTVPEPLFAPALLLG
ncbi:MAG: hypothetical protein AAGC67_18110, partial [Myxococcota bacterium]